MSIGLERAGFKVKGFSDPHAAIDYFNDPNGPCGFVLSDARMPGMSGCELARRIKGKRPNVKIILMSAFEMRKEEFELVLPRAPIDDFLQKPFQVSQLVEVING